MLYDVLVGKTKHQTATPRRAARHTLRDMTSHSVNIITELQLHSPEGASQPTLKPCSHRARRRASTRPIKLTLKIGSIHTDRVDARRADAYRRDATRSV